MESYPFYFIGSQIKARNTIEKGIPTERDRECATTVFDQGIIRVTFVLKVGVSQMYFAYTAVHFVTFENISSNIWVSGDIYLQK